MNIKILSEYGYEEALLGLSLSYNQPLDKMPNVVTKLLNRELDGGELKFLEFITVYLDVTAPRYFWQQFDTYRIGIEDDGSGHKINVPKQSESTMHTILKHSLTQLDFEEPIYENTLWALNRDIANKDFDNVKNNLPESFLQRRIMVTNYKTLIHIIKQRKNHRLKVWTEFNQHLIDNLEHREIVETLIWGN